MPLSCKRISTHIKQDQVLSEEDLREEGGPVDQMGLPKERTV